MIISRKLSESEKCRRCFGDDGHAANKSLLETTGFWHDDFNQRRRMIFAWRFVPKRRMKITQAISQQLDESLQQLAQATGEPSALQVRRWKAPVRNCRSQYDVNFCAGEYAAELAIRRWIAS
jgi:FdrA protein